MMDPYASHLPALSFVLRRLTGLREFSILEVGCGYYSTPILSAYAAAAGCEHRILESDPSWADKMGTAFGVAIERHEEGTLPASVTGRPWGLVFLDSRPESSRREYAVALKETARVILLHDSNPNWDEAYGYSQIVGQWKYRRSFESQYPHTLLLTSDDEAWALLD